MTPGCRVAALHDIEALPVPAGLRWRPVRGELGVRAFGIGSFVADAGQDVVEPHTEAADGRGHEELYLVIRGAARFTLDGVQVEARAGTLVFVRDPAVHRHAVATEPGTEVLALGGDPVFRPSGSEWMWRVRALLPDRVEAAQAVVEAGLAEVPDSPGLAYARALVEACRGRPGAARELLAGTFEQEPRLRDEARSEPLLAGIAV